MPVLACVVLLEVAAVLWVLPADPVLSYRIFTAAGITRQAAAPSNTPPPVIPAPVGANLPSGASSARLRAAAPRASRAYLLVAVGDCSGCISADLRAWRREAAAKHIGFVVLTTAPPAEAAHTMRASGIEGATVVTDPGGRLTRWLNAAWAARPYLFDRRWRLVWAGAAPTPGYDPFKDRAFLTALQGVAE